MTINSTPDLAHVALVSAYFWPERLGCATHISDVARYLKKTYGNLDVLAAIPHYPSKRAEFDWNLCPGDELIGTKIKRAWVFDRSAGGFGIRILSDWLFAAQTFAACVLTRRHWDAILILVPAVMAIPAVRVAQPSTRLVAAVYDIESTLAHATGIIASSKVAFLLNAFEAWCLNRADAILVLTPQMKQVLESIGVKRPVSVVPIWPSIENDLVAPRTHSNTLMYAGGLARRHGRQVLPEFWRHLCRKVPDCRLIIQGDESQIRETRRALNEIGGEVVFRPTVRRDFLAQALAEGDLQLVLVLDTAADSAIPSKAITSLSAGVPFLSNAPKGSALADFAMKSGGGHVVPSGSPEALAQAAAELLSAPEKLNRMGMAGFAYVQKVHSREELLRHYCNLLLNLGSVNC
jgi:glycosyltransferase involved in cell wall biosynthesis